MSNDPTIIKSLTLHNFRSHTTTHVDFGQITEIVPKKGAPPNNIGKTNILRALRILIHHAEFPQKAITRGCANSIITLELVDGHVISRNLQKSKQTVSIVYPDGSKKEFYGVNDSKPYVLAAIGIEKVSLDPSSGLEDFNYIQAGSPTFLLEDRADMLLRKMSTLIGSSQIEDISIELSKEIKSLEHRKRLKEKDISYYTNISVTARTTASKVEQTLYAINKVEEAIKENTKLLEKAKQLQLSCGSKDTKKLAELVEDVKPLAKSVIQHIKLLDILVPFQDELTSINSILEEQNNIKSKYSAELLALQAEISTLNSTSEVCPTCQRPL